MADQLRDIEPFYGWIPLYSHEADPLSPFHEVEHSQTSYDRFIYTYEAHPLWDDIGSENLLVKILYADYGLGYAILELFGEWNDLHLNDFKLLAENCLTYLADNGIHKYVFIAENVFNAYLQDDDYYREFADEIGEDGWMCLLRLRQNVREDFVRYGIGHYFYWSGELDEVRWRKLKPWELFQLVDSRMNRLLPS